MKKKNVAIVGIVAGIAMLLIGLFKAFSLGASFDETVIKYISGDAYNYIIEASLRGGLIASQSTYFVGGIICIVLSLFKLSECNATVITNSSETSAQEPVAPQPIIMSNEEELLYGANDKKSTENSQE